MARILGEIDTLSRISGILKNAEIGDYTSIDEILSHRRNCELDIQSALSSAADEYENELKNQSDLCIKLTDNYDEDFKRISDEKAEMIDLLSSRLNSTSLKSFTKIVLRARIYLKKKTAHFSTKWQLRSLTKEISVQTKALAQIKTNKKEIIQSKARKQAAQSYYALELFRQNESILTGAIGEQQAVEELKNLSDSFVVINNLQMSMNRPIYNLQTNDRIYSIQADHLVVGPTGVFLIETKHWSEYTAKLQSNFSPIDQVKRTNYALFCILNPRPPRGFFASLFAKTNTKKIPIRSVLLMTNSTTQIRDPFVKVLSLSELNSYIRSFTSNFSEEDIHDVLSELGYGQQSWTNPKRR